MIWNGFLYNKFIWELLQKLFIGRNGYIDKIFLYEILKLPKSSEFQIILHINFPYFYYLFTM